MGRIPVLTIVASTILIEGILAYAALPDRPLALVASLIPAIALLCGLKAMTRNRETSVDTAANQDPEHEAAQDVIEMRVPEPAHRDIAEQHRAHRDIGSFLNVYRKSVPELFQSVVLYLNKTSEPMSETLLNLKTGITGFLSAMNKTREEFENSDKLEEVQRGVSLLRNHITEITTENNRSCARFSKEIDTLSVQMASIADFLSSISDIAARVHVLSINASIEAARAGQHGRGFKVIANEIQKLSSETQGFVTTIGDTLKKTDTVFGALKQSMKDNQAVIERQSSENSSTYEDISRLLTSRLGDIKGVYKQVIDYIQTVDIDITTLSPITMLHAIITQEIENLEKIWSDFLVMMQASLDGQAPEAEDRTDNAAVEKIRERLTTSRELDALGKAVIGLGLDGAASIRKTETDIEFF